MATSPGDHPERAAARAAEEEAEGLEKLAALLEDHGVATVGELPEDAIPRLARTCRVITVEYGDRAYAVFDTTPPEVCFVSDDGTPVQATEEEAGMVAGTLAHVTGALLDVICPPDNQAR